MKDYIQWFMEIYLGDCYIDKESFDLWIKKDEKLMKMKSKK